MSRLGALVDPVTALVGGGLKAVGKAITPDMPQPVPQPLPERGAADPAIQQRAVEQFATREAAMQKAAVAAGATRSDNEADLLGYSRPAKLRSARRTLGGL